MAKAGLAAGLAWWLARTVTDLPDPILAPLTAVVSVRVSVRASVRIAIQRSIAVVLGVFLALIVGDAIGLNGLTVGVLVAASLGIAEFVLHLPRQAATQLPISILIVLTAVSSGQDDYGWRRAIETVLGAAVGVTVSLLLPGSRRRDAANRSRGWRTCSKASSTRWVQASRRNGRLSKPSSGAGVCTQCAIDSYGRPSTRWVTDARPRAGTAAIASTSRNSGGTRMRCRGSSAPRSAFP